MTDAVGPKERILNVFLKEPTNRHYGYALMERTAVKSGTLYPQLARLEKLGVIVGQWDTDERRPRRYYQLTEDGASAARLELAVLRTRRRQSRGSEG